MSILSLGLEKDDDISFLANGADETEAIKALETLVRNEFVLHNA